ncbi:hypothetical protein KP509_07G055600 [Ceratopteris richardii]|uniref:Glutaredoxin domain-containing protein n=1 Tax=Ceratopteris richardii TaxID=49495 RepID=A0A8T2UH71_CERRI|nr:hypothetical protein KP509_07G055600 [Ceratopteris richardii]
MMGCVSSKDISAVEPDRSCSQQGSFLNFQPKPKSFQEVGTLNAAKDTTSFVVPDVKQSPQPTKYAVREGSWPRPKATSHSQIMETINTWELMDGLEEGSRDAQEFSADYDPRKLRKSRPRSKSFDMAFSQTSSNRTKHAASGPVHGAGATSNTLLFYSGDLTISAEHSPQPAAPNGSPLACQSSLQRATSPRICESSPTAPLIDSPAYSSFRNSSVESEASKETSELVSPSETNSLGLKLLLNSVEPPSYYENAVTRRAHLKAAGLSFDSGADHLREKQQDSQGRKKRCSGHQSMDFSKGLDVPLFDPSLIRTFEQALEVTPRLLDDDWLQQSMDENTTNSSSSDNTWPLSETVSDAESGPHGPKSDQTMLCESKIYHVKQEEKESKSHLDCYEMRCPPYGADKVVLYYTSMRGVRKTYEECCTVRLILKGLGVHVEERDVWMHSQFKEDLRVVLGDILKVAPLVPHLFIRGRHIGGAEEVKKLHEDAKLTDLIEGIVMDVAHNECDGCGDVRFVPCFTCNGSCKVRSEHDEVFRCPDCNENGLIMCPICRTV